MTPSGTEIFHQKEIHSQFFTGQFNFIGFACLSLVAGHCLHAKQTSRSQKGEGIGKDEERRLLSELLGAHNTADNLWLFFKEL